MNNLTFLIEINLMFFLQAFIKHVMARWVIVSGKFM